MSDTPVITPLSDEENSLIRNFYKGYRRPWVRVGSQGYLLPPGYVDHAAEIKSLEVRPDDVWVLSFSRSGTTWLEELVWLVNNDLDFAAAEKTSLHERFAYIEYPTQLKDGQKDSGRATKYDFRTVDTLSSPRYMKSHLPISLLPSKLLSTAKVLYVARDPRDVAVSFFFMHKLFRYFDDDVSFEQFWSLFKNDQLIHMPLIPHVEEAWNQRNNPNLLFVFYEDMQKDLEGVIEKVAAFMGRPLEKERRKQLAEYLSFGEMSKRSNFGKPGSSEMRFMRKGKSGAWVEYFHGKTRKEAEDYVEKRLEHSDLRYPSVDQTQL